jgi:hypothetical protein
MGVQKNEEIRHGAQPSGLANLNIGICQQSKIGDTVPSQMAAAEFDLNSFKHGGPAFIKGTDSLMPILGIHAGENGIGFQ